MSIISPKDVRDHPDYERGYSDRWDGFSRRSDTAEYVAGYEAARRAEAAFIDAGFTKAGGIWTKRMALYAGSKERR